jgi:uncharacterized membrane protein YcaP (DUF421 family)
MNMLRQSNAFSVHEVEYALLRPNGSIRVLKKADDTVKRQDLNLPLQHVYLPTT